MTFIGKKSNLMGNKVILMLSCCFIRKVPAKKIQFQFATESMRNKNEKHSNEANLLKANAIKQ